MQALGGLSGEDLALARGSRLLFQGLNFRATRGETLSVEGANGAGKTSLLRAIAGLLELKAGHIAIETNANGTLDDPEERRLCAGWLAHQDGIKLQLTPRENLGFFAGYMSESGDVDASLDRVDLRRVRDLPAQYLSAGQRRRLALARLMLSERPLWLLDEPLSALDIAGRELVRSMMAQHCNAGGIVVAATHEPLGVACQRLVLGAS